jgi:DNA-binding LacI/PurR family transcriptional regulator
LPRTSTGYPADLSIVAVDDHEYATVVGLSTMHQRVTDHGPVAARLVLERRSTWS